MDVRSTTGVEGFDGLTSLWCMESMLWSSDDVASRERCSVHSRKTSGAEHTRLPLTSSSELQIQQGMSDHVGGG